MFEAIIYLLKCCHENYCHLIILRGRKSKLPVLPLVRSKKPNIKRQAGKPIISRQVIFAFTTNKLSGKIVMQIIFLVIIVRYIVLNRLGNYLYVEASFPRLPDETARLSFPTRSSPFGCIKFWYHMSGDDIG